MRIVLEMSRTISQSRHKVTRRRQRERIENLFEEIMTEIFPNLVNEVDIQVQEVQNSK